ncbi:MAG TPA: hypothetical protein P5228_04060 [Bacteroidales bacterium]|nr:hypothetical protein [Bacteroidales bacterium]HRZ50324.1 hypothetical protein [Bacteroidales bacterium]
MKRYRTVETGRVMPTDEEIASLKPPFEEVLKRPQPSVWKGQGGTIRWMITLVAGAAAVVAGIVFWQSGRNAGDPVDPAPLQLGQAIPAPRINPPHPGMVHYENFTVSPGKKGVFTSRKGSKITVPPNAFRYADGTPCVEPVTVQFAEFHNVQEIYLSGIPMQYDSAGISYTFESAGMFDIGAMASGNPLELAPGKGIDVDLVSEAEGVYNFYYFDTTGNGWEYRYTEPAGKVQGGPSAPALPSGKTGKAQSGAAAAATVAQSVAASPDPVTELPDISRRNPKNFAFRVDVDEKTFPELAGVKELLFEVIDNSADKKYLRGTWDSVSLARGDNDAYTISLFRLSKGYTFRARPVLDTKAYEEALQQFNTAEARRTAEREARREQALNSIENTTIQDQVIKGVAATRGATIYDLGTWNWDRPVPEPRHAIAGNGGFTDDRGNPLNPRMIYLVQKKVNILWNYRPYQRWMYSRTQENLLWFVLPNGRYALVADQTLKSREATLQARIVPASEALEEIGRFI